jgi:hypothetical protein
MEKPQIATEEFTNYYQVSRFLQEIMDMGYNLTEYFINITSLSTNWNSTYVVFYDKRYKNGKSTLI